MVRKQESKNKFGRKTVSPHYTAPEGALRDERRVIYFVLVSLNYRRERKHHLAIRKFYHIFGKCLTEK